MSSVLLDLERPKAWPQALRDYLDDHHDLFLNWETGNGKVSERAFDDLRAHGVLQPYEITGWHCTRLTDGEIDHVLQYGMQLPDTSILNQRIDALVTAGLLSEEIALRLKSDNQSGETSRAGMVWFCFFPLRNAGESGTERFFRHWGGEGLYNSHEDDPVTHRRSA